MGSFCSTRSSNMLHKSTSSAASSPSNGFRTRGGAHGTPHHAWSGGPHARVRRWSSAREELRSRRKGMASSKKPPLKKNMYSMPDLFEACESRCSLFSKNSFNNPMSPIKVESDDSILYIESKSRLAHGSRLRSRSLGVMKLRRTTFTSGAFDSSSLLLHSDVGMPVSDLYEFVSDDIPSSTPPPEETEFGRQVRVLNRRRREKAASMRISGNRKRASTQVSILGSSSLIVPRGRSVSETPRPILQHLLMEPSSPERRIRFGQKPRTISYDLHSPSIFTRMITDEDD
eukprot:TRINITY_DN7258_c0_g1_i1.p1 TRINITY_DN7258_c0_g1~~TRINITY_DN7258_c0_g1_i1.p1  ORF type:complete len:301 (-),score=46.77 TRINITY_DN7258_c0_g1_i1:304-1164(-)